MYSKNELLSIKFTLPETQCNKSSCHTFSVRSNWWTISSAKYFDNYKKQNNICI